MKRALLYIMAFVAVLPAAAQSLWPEPTPEARPGARWWWMGSAVTEAGLTWNMEQYAAKGIGTLEITPIYGVQGNEANEVDHLSARWMELYRHAVREGERLGIRIDLNNGTGWPWGSPAVSAQDAAQKLVVAGGQRSVQPTKQKVKRAAPGGEGWVLDHFSARAVEDYLTRFADSMASGPWPAMLFNDSYEVYGADWTPGFEREFERRRGYRIEDHWDEFLAPDSARTDIGRRIMADYRRTLGELLLENFTERWTAWAHAHGSLTRNQAHGSPANLIDIYAAVDTPEAEGFGMTDFGIAGLRRDSLVRPNDSDLSMLKYASSAAHITGKRFTGAETFTWLTEHFRTSLCQMKPDLDLLFCAGVNRVIYHGTTYSPPEAAWPGWKFYASVDMSPTNSIWHDVDALNAYVARCQSMLQWGTPDNDFLLYFPVHDLWHEQSGRLMMFDIHKMAQRAPRFIAAVNTILDAGYDADYISDAFLLSTRYEAGEIITEGGARYRAIVVPGAQRMPVETLRHLTELAGQGARVIFLDRLPCDVPGFHRYKERQQEFKAILEENTPTIDRDLSEYDIAAEELGSLHGLRFIRRRNPDGHHYFVAALRPEGFAGWVTLSVPATGAVLLDPMDGASGQAATRITKGKLQVYLDIPSGGSIFIRTFERPLPADAPRWSYYRPSATAIALDDWRMTLGEATMQGPGSWTREASLRDTMGTATYRTQVQIPETGEWLLDLGDVRESARVRVDGREVAVLWAVPFRTRLSLSEGVHRIEVEVTSLPANRIAAMDRRGERWRIFEDINMVKLNYVAGDYAHWKPLPAGLLGPVRLTKLVTDTIYDR